jgi:hypothetical protein
MSILEFLNRCVAFLGSILPYGFALILIIGAWGYFSQEEYDEDFVTFTVSCHTVVNDLDHYPQYIVNYCLERRMER